MNAKSLVQILIPTKLKNIIIATRLSRIRYFSEELCGPQRGQTKDATDRLERVSGKAI